MFITSFSQDYIQYNGHISGICISPKRIIRNSRKCFIFYVLNRVRPNCFMLFILVFLCLLVFRCELSLSSLAQHLLSESLESNFNQIGFIKTCVSHYDFYDVIILRYEVESITLVMVITIERRTHTFEFSICLDIVITLYLDIEIANSFK